MKFVKALKRKEKCAATSALALAAAVWPAASLFAQTVSRPNVPSAVGSGQVPVTNPSSVSSASLSVALVKQVIPPDAKRRWALVRRVRIDGGFPELQNQTAALIAGFQGRRVTLADAFQFAASVQQAYGEAGYPLVNAILEPQFFAEGEVRIKIIDGFIENLDLTGVPQDLRRLVSDRLAPIVGRKHITLPEIQRHILLIGELPGVTGGTKTKLGNEFGGVILVVEATETPLIYGAGVNNYLTREYGTFLFSQGFAINNTLGMGETIHAEVASSDDFGQFFNGQAKTQAFSFGGSLPIGPDGFSTSANYSQSRVSPTPQPGAFPLGVPGNEGFHGVLQDAAVRANYPLLLSQQQTLRFQLGFDFVDDKEDVAPVPNFVTAAGVPIYNIFHDQYEDARVAGEWSINFPWAWGGHAISALIYNRGIGGITGDAFVPLSRPGASPDFNKLATEVRIQQPLPEGFIFAALGRAQTSFGQSLMEPEELQLAGPDVLSGFGLGTVYVDSGGVGRAELQRPFPLAVSGATAVAAPYVFGAWGAGRFEQVFPGENPDVHATSFGGGVRANASFAGWPFNETLNLEAARVTSNVPFAREGYVGSFTYQMKYGGDPFSGGGGGTPWLALARMPDSDPDSRPSNFTSSGWYGGLNFGYAFDASPKISSTGTVLSNALDIFGNSNASAVSAGNITGAFPTSFASPIGGGQIGYNFAPGGPFLLGAEADIDGAGASSLTTSSRQANAFYAGGATIDTLTTTLEDSKSLDWLGTLRGRAGWMATPDLLAYATGGLAFGGVEADTRASQSWIDPAAGPLSASNSTVAIGHYSNTLVGWTLGGGVEWMFAPGLSLKGEYLFYDLGSVNFASGTITNSIFGAPPNVVASNSSAHFDGHIVRVGLNYHFGMDEEPSGRIVKGRKEDDPPVPVWDGFYAGVNTGYSWGFRNSASNSATVGSTALDTALASSFAPAAAMGIAGQSNAEPDGMIGGGQIGYNLQLNRGLVGIETDLQGSGASGRNAYVTNYTFAGGAVGLNTRVDNLTSLDWFGTLRGRIGLFVLPNLLAYATGGLAYGETTSTTMVDQQWSGGITATFKTTPSFGSVNKIMAGWTAGGGFEWMFARNLSLKGEYLLYNLGDVNYGSSPSLTTFGVSNSALPWTTLKYDGQIARVGLNYYFAP